MILLFPLSQYYGSKFITSRGWWRPMIFTAGIASAKYFYQHLSRRNTLTQARRNIARHYDLSNEMFSMILDETMTYSCAVFKSANEDLKDAQLRKLSAFIKKGKIADNHEVLEIGCGWGSFALEVVKQTGCRYTEEQLTLAEARVKELLPSVCRQNREDRITFLLLDYRQLPDAKKYDRIISCGMIEHVGHEYIEEFFSCCESALAEHGLLILQFIAISDSRYDEYRRSSYFIKEYIFPGGCLPSLSRVTTAMASTSTLCVEHVENIGIHYHQTLRCWRENILKHQREVHSFGFDEKFIRTWKYYFDYCAAGFKSRTLLDYQ
ncbi:Tuberculostearic acid methyltransferase UfaA1-like protein, partial [Drosera capensis]